MLAVPSATPAQSPNLYAKFITPRVACRVVSWTQLVKQPEEESGDAKQ